MAEKDVQGVRVLPDGWAWTTIGEITQPIKKIKPGENPDACFTYLDISSIDNKSHRIAEPKTYYGAEAPSRARQLIQANDVLFSTVRTYLKNIALVPDAYDRQIASTGFAVLRGESGVSSKYLFYYTLTDRFLNELGKLQRGTSYPAVRDGDVRIQPIPFVPFPEQRRIVAAIETHFTRLDAGVAALARARANLRRYKAAVLKAACEGRLVPTEAELARRRGAVTAPLHTAPLREPPLHTAPLPYEPADRLLARILAERRARWEAAHPGKRYVEPAAPDTEGLPELPEGWCWATVEQVSEMTQYGTSEKADLDPSGIPVLRMGNIRDGELDFSDLKHFPADWPDLDNFVLHDGDVLFNRTNSAELVGKTAVYRSSHPKSVFASYLIRVKTHKHYLPDLLSFCINSIHGRKYIASVVSQQVGQANVSGTKLLRMSVPLPPLAEQHRIVAEVERRLSVAAALERGVETALARAARLRQSILKRAFEGRLVPTEMELYRRGEVPSPPEPASTLLKRIQAQREDVATTPLRADVAKGGR